MGATGFNQVLANPGRDIPVFHGAHGDGALDEVALAAAELRCLKAKRRYRALALDSKRPWDGVFPVRGANTPSPGDANAPSLTLPIAGSIIRPPFRFGQFTGYGAVW